MPRRYSGNLLNYIIQSRHVPEWSSYTVTFFNGRILVAWLVEADMFKFDYLDTIGM